jgi:homocysteine S-methyltransferase
MGKELITRSVRLAIQARAQVTEVDPNRKCFVAGSVGPYGAFLANGAEYTGDYELPEEDMKEFHRPRIETLVLAGVDVLACETIPSFEEMRALLSLLEEFPTAICWVSFTMRDENHLSDGTPLSKALALLNASPQVVAVGVNCVPEDTVTKALVSFSALTQKPLLAYPNSGELYDPVTKTWSGPNSRGSHLIEQAQEWNKLGARLIGGCCRTTPDDIRTIKTAFSSTAIKE